MKINMLSYSPLEQFNVNKLISLDILGLDLSFTNSSLAIVVAIVFVTAVFLNTPKKIVPNRWQSSNEMLVKGLTSVAQDNMGTSGERFVPFIGALFLFILALNVLGMVPYSYSVTAQVIVTFALSLSIWIAVTLLGFINYKANFLSMFMPQGSPLALAPLLVSIELLSYVARAISLGVRLAANVTSGHILLAIIGGFVFQMITSASILTVIAILPMALLVALTILEIGVAIIQAYVFTLLTAIYLNDAIHLH